MTNTAAILDKLRDTIIAQPEVILEDRAMMRALVAANDRAMGENVIDMRGAAMDLLETSLDRLETTHSTVLAAAYENLAGTQQVHRAVLAMLEPTDFTDFLTGLGTEVAEILRVDQLRLVLESTQADDPALAGLEHVLRTARPGFISDYVTHGRGGIRHVVLRATQGDAEGVYGEDFADLRSEALLRIDFGQGRLPGMLALGSRDPRQFTPAQGADLLTFFADVFERAMRRWLA